VASRIYRDIEKIYRLIGLYQGNRQQMEQHVKIIDKNVELSLRSADIKIQHLRFDFMMTGVFNDGDEVFKAEQPEQTLAYMLFCESIESLLLSRDVTAFELLDWCLLIRERVSRTDQPSDLATLLWKNPFPHIRCYLYNLLLETGVDDKTKAWASKELVDLGKTEFLEREQISDETGWHARDREWVLPSGDLVMERNLNFEENLSDLEKLRDELADASISDRARHIIRFRKDELEGLSTELESYDFNHIEFNLLAEYFELLEPLSKLEIESKSTQLILESLSRFVSSIVERFHGGLLVFLLHKLEAISEKPKWKSFRDKIYKSLTDALAFPKNVKNIAVAFSEESRVNIAKQLVPYIRRDHWGTLFDLLLQEKNSESLKAFLSVLTQNDETADGNLWALGESRLSYAIPLIRSFEWAGRERFFMRCLFHRSSTLMRATLPFMMELPVKAQEGLALFDRLSENEKKLLAESMLMSAFSKERAPFVLEIVRSGRWADGSADLMSIWIRVAFKFLGSSSFEAFDAYVSHRRFMFWARFPKEREAILTLALQQREPQMQEIIRKWAERERSLLFQKSTLKQKLAARS